MPTVRKLTEEEISSSAVEEKKESLLPKVFSITIPIDEIVADGHNITAFLLSSLNRKTRYDADAYDFTDSIQYIRTEVEKHIDEVMIVAESDDADAEYMDLLMHVNDFYAYNAKLEGNQVVIDFELVK